MLSQLAVFKDIVPGYRIRALTETEKAEKVSQMVQRTRDWEQGLVGVYQTYLRSLETEIKGMHNFCAAQKHISHTILSQERPRPNCTALYVHIAGRSHPLQFPCQLDERNYRPSQSQVMG